MNQNFYRLFFESFLENLPRFLGVIFVLLFGWIVSEWIEGIVIKFLERAKLNQALKRLGWEEALFRFGIRLNAPKFIGEIVKCFIFILFLVACSEILGLVQFSQFLGSIINYFPNIFISIFIFIFAVYLVDFSQKIFFASLEKEKITYSRFLGKSLGWTIWILAALAILYQLKIVPTLILTVFVGVVVIIVLIVGISFGLGGKKMAAKILKELEEKFKK